MKKNTSFLPVKHGLHGDIYVPGDKSISHRAVMFGSLAKGKTVIENFLDGEDCLHTIEIFRKLGISIERSRSSVEINSEGFKSFQEPLTPLYLGNSGTTARLMPGILVALPCYTVIYGDPFLTVRPMDRVVTPLKQMGAQIDGRKNGNFLPLSIRGTTLTGIEYKLPVKSAQVKSAVLLAGLFAEGETTVIEKAKTRDHTENMLRAFGADIRVKENAIRVTNKNDLTACNVTVPGDISSAAFFMVAAAVVPNSRITLKNVGLNKTRSGILDVLLDMNATIHITNQRKISGELLGDVTVTYSHLKGTTIASELIPRLIDEIPIIALLATQAEGTTIIKDAEELRVKETDRINAVIDVLSTLGANIEEQKDGMIIHGKTSLTGGKIKSYSDHRIAMMGIIASLITEDIVTLDDTSSIAVSYPRFFEDLKSITNE
ncbi:3-phosphoshikimate 1-carboxyvinyltransferase [Pseudogracilibacillus sp. SO30301A]|uniref:3-phosphoshikimate 1-carboxyvinyltransferase n=1 Tax=Pseudogracilibacillus sp. SO30301A TaxID=3098291 RepID=UPI00300DD12B